MKLVSRNYKDLDREQFIKKLIGQRARHQKHLDDVLEELTLINGASAIIINQRIEDLQDRIRQEIEDNA